MSSNLYFAYGSNLNQADVNAWCRKRGYPEGLLQFKSRVSLPDFSLAFTHRSRSRNGGVLDLRESLGQVVPGVVFKVDDKGWAALDHKEGAPSTYQRVDVTVIDDRGDTMIATTYRVNPERAQLYVPPSDDYLAVVREGLDHWGFCSDLLDATAANRIAPCPEGFFFYGTLLRGEHRFPVVRKFGIECVLLAQTFGRLVDLGRFPGLVDVGVADSLVQGEFVRLSDPERAIAALDAIEGFRGFGKSGSLYRRTWIGVDVGEGRIRQAWTYCLDADVDQASPIPSGDWREHSGRRQDFLARLADIHSGGDEATVAARIASGYPFCFDDDREQVVRSLLPLNESLASGLLSERKLAQASGLWTATP
jgi:gamma-glutamylcyclotransferase (GGCT)/AIG2-like uncharacterized protein YtfP